MTDTVSDTSTAESPPDPPASGSTKSSPPDPPEPPEGYGEPTQFSYPGLWLSVGSLVLFVLSVAGFGELMAAIRGGAPTEYTVGLAGIGVAAALSVATVVVHELVHGLAYRLLGYRVEYGIALNMGAAYAAAFGQFQTRGDNLAVGLAPLLAFTVILTPLLAGPLPVALAAFLALVVNTSGAVGDLYLVW